MHNDNKDDKKGTTEEKRRLYLENNAVDFVGLKNSKINLCNTSFLLEIQTIFIVKLLVEIHATSPRILLNSIACFIIMHVNTTVYPNTNRQ